MKTRVHKARILLITLRSDVGGGPKHVYDLARNLKAKHSVSIYIASPLEEPFGSKFVDIADEHFVLPTRKFSLATFIKLVRFCRQRQIQAIHSHGRGAGIYSRLFKPFGYRIVHTYHGIHQEPSWKGRLKFMADVCLEPLTDVSIFVSQGELEVARKSGLARRSIVKVINNGIEYVEQRTLHKKTRVIGTLSRLTYQKGLDVLLEYFKYLKKKHPELNLTLLIAGGGEEAGSLSEQAKRIGIENSVSFVGETHDPKSFLSKLDIYVSTSRWEGLPLSVLEAMNEGIPCVLSPTPGHESFLTNQVAQPAGSPEEFACNIRRLYEHDDFREEISQKARHYIKQNHNIERQMESTFHTYGIAP